jgi:Tfp pilus assembly protein PilF
MGICMKEAGRLDESLSFYNQALKHRPQDKKILFNKVLCLVSMEEFERARKTLQLILKVDPQYDKARQKLAELEKLEKGGAGAA